VCNFIPPDSSAFAFHDTTAQAGFTVLEKALLASHSVAAKVLLDAGAKLSPRSAVSHAEHN
jgi:hypothetical protein